MTQLASTVLRRRQSPRWRKLGRILRRTLYVNLALILVAVIGLAALYLRLSIGPMSVGGLPERVATVSSNNNRLPR